MPALPQIYPYKAGPIDSVVMPGETVGVWVNKVYKFYKVFYIEGLTRSDPLTVDLGALAAGAVSAVTQLLLLEMPDKEFGQFRCEVLDDVSVILYQGRADQRHKLENVVATMSRFTHLHDPCAHGTEFYVHEDDFAFMQAQNFTSYALTQARVAFWGFRYVLEEDKEHSWPRNPPENWTRIPATAHL